MHISVLAIPINPLPHVHFANVLGQNPLRKAIYARWVRLLPESGVIVQICTLKGKNKACFRRNVALGSNRICTSEFGLHMQSYLRLRFLLLYLKRHKMKTI